jgi:acetylornithine aminotransferase
MAKGMAGGFPIGGVLISPEFEAVKGMLGTTFGGNHLAMAAAIAVADIIKDENLVQNALEVGDYLKSRLQALSDNQPKIKEVRGRGLMLGVEFDGPVAEIRKKLLFDKHIFTGVSGKNMIRLLAPLVLSKEDVDIFIKALEEVL